MSNNPFVPSAGGSSTSAAFKAPPMWAASTNWSKGDFATSPTDFCVYVRKTDGVTATDPSSDTTNWQNTNGIKSIQRGVISINSGSSATATITSVNTGKTELRFLGQGSSGQVDNTATPYVVLTNATTITATRYNSAAFQSNVSWELTERF